MIPTQNQITDVIFSTHTTNTQSLNFIILELPSYFVLITIQSPCLKANQHEDMLIYFSKYHGIGSFSAIIRKWALHKLKNHHRTSNVSLFCLRYSFSSSVSRYRFPVNLFQHRGMLWYLIPISQFKRDNFTRPQCVVFAWISFQCLRRTQTQMDIATGGVLQTACFLSSVWTALFWVVLFEETVLWPFNFIFTFLFILHFKNQSVTRNFP